MNIRVFIVVLYDMLVIVTAWWLSYFLRFNFDIPDHYSSAILSNTLLIVSIHVAIFYITGLYKGMWRYVSIPDLKKIVIALLVSISVIVMIVLIFQIPDIPRSVLLMLPVLSLVFMGGARITYRVWREWSLYGHLLKQGKPVLVIGAGDAGVMLVRELAKSADWCVVGMLDDDKAKKDRSFHGVKILGMIKDIGSIARKLDTRYAILALPSSSDARRQAMRYATAAGLSILTVPDIEDLLSDRVTISSIRQVEIADLLGREPVSLDDAGLHQFLDNKAILVTGAGGSIGSELCRQVSSYNPKNIILLDHSEYHLYMIDKELGASYPGLCIPILGNIRDEESMLSLFETCQPDLVIHTAAYKHVPLLEYNISEGIRTNITGTCIMADLANEYGAEKFLLVSTDKAVNPVNILGVTKRVAEIYTQNKNSHSDTANITVRFGNVLDSAGSVVPLFRSQIENGGPVTVTHPDITRYFMTIPESVSLILQAGAMGEGGEIFVLDMGDPVKIDDMARQMIILSGKSPETIGIQYIGLRPGEKLYEELFYDQESLDSTSNPKIMLASSRDYDWDKIIKTIDILNHSCMNKNPDELVDSLRYLVPEYVVH